MIYDYGFIPAGICNRNLKKVQKCTSVSFKCRVVAESLKTQWRDHTLCYLGLPLMVLLEELETMTDLRVSPQTVAFALKYIKEH